MDTEEIKLLEQAFADGYRSASDKLGFLHLAGIPMEIAREGHPPGKMIEVKMSQTFTVGQAAPGFGSPELVYHPLPGKMVKSQCDLEFVFVHAQGVETYSLAQLLAIRDGRDIDQAAHDHAHDHGHQHHHHHDHDHHH